VELIRKDKERFRSARRIPPSGKPALGIAINYCGGIDVSKDIGTNPTEEKCKIMHRDEKIPGPDHQAIHRKHEALATIQRTPNSRLTTSQILNSRELTPPEKKRTIKAKGQMNE
jgi:hypothetical protein